MEDRELIRARQVALCQALGLDPATTSQVTIDFAPSGTAGATVVSWSGRRRLTRAETARCLDAVAKAVVAGEVVDRDG